MADGQVGDLDGQIIALVRTILDQGTFVVETFNEAVLMKLFELRGTPITPAKCHRNIERDYQTYLRDEADARAQEGLDRADVTQPCSEANQKDSTHV